MMELLSYILGIGPYALAAVLVAIGLVGFAPWVWKNPERWIFGIIFALSFSPAGGDASADGSLFRQLAWSALFALVAAQLLWDKKLPQEHLVSLVPKSMWLLLSLIFVSLAWSPEPVISFKRAIQMVGVLLISMLVARNALLGQDLLAKLRYPVGFFVLIGLLSAVLAPSTAFDTDRSLRAISTHKNTWGQFSLLTCLVFLFSWVRDKNSASLLLLLPAFISLILSKSTTSLLTFLLITGAVGVWMALTFPGMLGKMLLIVGILCAALAFHGYLVITGEWPLDALSRSVFQATGKDSSLTGRTFLWELMYAEIAKHPWLGAGYGGFWTSTAGASAVLVSHLNWGPPVQAHSGYIDVVNELGVLGAGLMAAIALVHARNIGALLRSSQSVAGMLHGSLLVSVLIINYAETSLLRTTHFWWVLFSMSIFEVHVLRHCQSVVPRPAADTSANSPGKAERPCA